MLSDLLAALGDRVEFASASAVFDDLARAEKAFGGMSYDTLALTGLEASGLRAGAVS